MRYASFVLLVAFLSAILCGCGSPVSSDNQSEYAECRGETMGTTYMVRYLDEQGEDYTGRIDSLLAEINAGVSTYLPESVISDFNNKGSLKLSETLALDTTDPRGHFLQNLRLSTAIFKISSGAFDPTVGPLVNLWGFGWEGRMPVWPDSQKVAKILGRIGLDKIQIDTVDGYITVRSAVDSMQLDFSAVAKGYAVDRVAALLTAAGVAHYLVEIGGEVRAMGVSTRSTAWVVGINTPSIDASPSSLFARVRLADLAMATSGNYRNFHNVDGRRTWHSIDPMSGYPEQNNLLSASVLHHQCGVADALATACMVKGKDACLEMINNLDGAEAFLIIATESGEMQTATTPGFAQYLMNK